MRFFYLFKVTVTFLCAFVIIGSSAALAKNQSIISSHHLEVIRYACQSMYPSHKVKRIKCRYRVRKEAGSLFNISGVPEKQRDSIIRHCESLKYGGEPEDRLKRYDKCLRNSLEDVAPEKVPLPPKLAIKPYILLDSSNCLDLPGKADEALSTYKIKFEEYLKNHVRGVVFLKDKFITNFWCTKKDLYFKGAEKKHAFDRKFYAVMLGFEPKDKTNFNLKYELYDIKTRGFIYMGRANIKPITLSQAPSEIFKHLKNARNQILHQIIKYDPSN